MTGPLADRVVFITGGGTGIGAATAHALAHAGARVAIMGRRGSRLDEVAAAIGERGGQCLVLPGDVRSFEQVERAAADTAAMFGGLDIVVANAAQVDHDPIDQADPERWAEVITTNVLGVMYAVRACLPRMYAAGRGQIVIVASASGRVTYVGEPAYVASKHALVAFADCLRKETARRGIRVTTLEPGLVDTPFIDWGAVRDLAAGIEPLTPDDCARAILFSLEQPPNVGINEIVIRPASQEL